MKLAKQTTQSHLNVIHLSNFRMDSAAQPPDRPTERKRAHQV